VSKAAVKVDDGTAGDDRPGAVRNPFKQLHLPKKPPRPRVGRPTRGRRPAGRGGLGRLRRLRRLGRLPAVPAPGGTGGSGNGASKPTSPAGDPLDIYHLSLRFGRAEAAQLKTYHDVARPLAAADGRQPLLRLHRRPQGRQDRGLPALLRRHRRPATGHCRPSSKSCQTIEVKEGDTEFFDLTVDGQAVQYQLDVVKVFKKGASTTAAAAAAYERHSNAGADMLRRAHRVGSSAFKGASTYRWLPDQRRARPHAQGRARRAPRSTAPPPPRPPTPRAPCPGCRSGRGSPPAPSEPVSIHTLRRPMALKLITAGESHGPA
jgi:hypothetical protein